MTKTSDDQLAARGLIYSGPRQVTGLFKFKFKSALDKNNLLHFPCRRKLSEEEEGLEFRDYTEITEPHS
jgi:hypothetical protein